MPLFRVLQANVLHHTEHFGLRMGKTLCLPWSQVVCGSCLSLASHGMLRRTAAYGYQPEGRSGGRVATGAARQWPQISWSPAHWYVA